jgi:transposase
MKFYTQQHKHYCGIDLHAKAMYVCILDQSGTILVHKNLPTTPEAFLRLIAPYREDLVVGVECIFTWYWLADLCSKEGIAFVLGHALYMKAIHGGKAKNDRIDAHKIAVLLRGGMFPFKGRVFTQPEASPEFLSVSYLDCSAATALAQSALGEGDGD